MRWIYRHEEIDLFRELRRFTWLYVQPQTRPLCTSGALLKDYETRRYDAYIVGSDQIWRPSYIDGLTDYFLGFLPSDAPVRRVAYGASFGTDEWEYGETLTRTCRQLAARFDALSVRERGGVALCRDRLGVDARWVLDPTMLLTPADYEELADDEAGRIFRTYRSGQEGAEMRPKDFVTQIFYDREPLSASVGNAVRGRLFGYLLDRTPACRTLGIEVARRLGCSFFSAMARAEGNVPLHTPLTDLYHPPVSAWLYAYQDAHYVLTDSFHGCVFSILFNRPFVTWGNSSRGQARFASLLSVFGLEDRMVERCDAGEIARRMCQPIDWERVNLVLRRARQESLDFLTEALGTVENFPH